MNWPAPHATHCVESGPVHVLHSGEQAVHVPVVVSRNWPSVQDVVDEVEVGMQRVRSFVSGVNPDLQVVQMPVEAAQEVHPWAQTIIEESATRKNARRIQEKSSRTNATVGRVSRRRIGPTRITLATPIVSARSLVARTSLETTLTPRAQALSTPLNPGAQAQVPLAVHAPPEAQAGAHDVAWTAEKVKSAASVGSWVVSGVDEKRTSEAEDEGERNVTAMLGGIASEPGRFGDVRFEERETGVGLPV
ncbi:hypothetical protein FRC07_006121 [Ceratobasidium sp. 392]|nr:hypothetical protein FRC07_006121 [Ceratobasidium sp. 392]